MRWTEGDGEMKIIKKHDRHEDETLERQREERNEWVAGNVKVFTRIGGILH